MILFTWDYNEEKVARFPHMGRRAWRWVFEWTYRSIEFREEVKSLEKDNTWHNGNPYYGVWINKYFHLGSTHTYYNGPHCCFSLGWIHFCWSPISGNCKKCQGIID